MQTLSLTLAQEPLDPVFALAASPAPTAVKMTIIVLLSFILLLGPFALFVRCLQDSAVASGHHSPDNHIPHWLALMPLLFVTSASAIYFYIKALKLLPPVASLRAQWRCYAALLCPCIEASAAALSLLAAALKLQVSYILHSCNLKPFTPLPSEPPPPPP